MLGHQHDAGEERGLRGAGLVIEQQATLVGASLMADGCGGLV
jgi:hypothetical protein